MKKYKLIKEYPGSPELGSERTGSEENCRLYPTKKCMENSPEFWEEVIEKDYEILSIKGKSGRNLVYYKQDDIFTTNDGICSITNFPNGNHGCKIHSVKRLSDGEVFTIGDTVTETITGNCNGWRISEFSLKDTRCFTAGVNINNIEKIEKPLFTTEDGVDIFQGDTLFYISGSNWNIWSTNARKEILPVPSYFKYFLTKEAAEEYILMNKPCLSMNDVYDICNRYWIRGEGNPTTAFAQDLKETVRTKI